VTYEHEVWFSEVARAESDLMRACPTMIGGRAKKESPEDYAERGIANIQCKLARLKSARAHLKRWKEDTK
jgi:hypothetical protein